MLDATSLVKLNGLEAQLGGGTITYVEDVTWVGRQVRFIGSVRDLNGELGDFVATVDLMPVPEPASLAALGLGAAALLRRRKRA